MKQKLEAGQYSVGEIIVPRHYENLVLENKQIVKKVYFVEGCKLPFTDVRRNALENHKQYMRNTSEDTFNLMSDFEVQKGYKV